MSTTLEIERSNRVRDLAAAVGQTVFTFDEPIVDIADLTVQTRATGATLWTTVAAGISKVLLAANAGCTVTFDTAPRPGALSPAVTVRLKGARVHERLTDVTRGGVVRSAALEGELDRTAIVLQELRRDVDEFQAAAIDVTAAELARDDAERFASLAAARALVPVWATRAALAAQTMPAEVHAARLGGCLAAGLGGADFVEQVSNPGTPSAIQTADGRWWDLAEQRLTDVMFAHLVTGSGTSEDWVAAIDALFLAGERLGVETVITGVRRCRGQIDTRPGRLSFDPGGKLIQTKRSTTGAFLTNVTVAAGTRQQSDIVIADARIDGSEYPGPSLFAVSSVSGATLVLPVSWTDPNGVTHTAATTDDAYTGFIVQAITGTGAPFFKNVTGYVAATRTLTLASAFSPQVTAGDVVGIGFNDNPFGTAWGAKDVSLRNPRFVNYPAEKQIPYVSGAKGFNYERGNERVTCEGGSFENFGSAVFGSAVAGEITAGVPASVLGMRAWGFHAKNCGSVVTVLNLDNVAGISAAANELNAVIWGFTWEDCGGAGARIVVSDQMKAGIINLGGANGVTIAHGRGFNNAGYPTWPTDFATRVGYGLSGNVGALIWGHARNSTVIDMHHTGNLDAVVHIGRARAVGDDAGPTGYVSGCFNWNIDGAWVYGAVVYLVNHDPVRGLSGSGEISGYWRLGANSASSGLVHPGLTNVTQLTLDLTELGTGKRVIGSPKAIIAAGNTFASFPAGTTDLRRVSLSAIDNVITVSSLATEFATSVTLPSADCRIEVYSSGATSANGILRTVGGVLMILGQASTLFEKTTGALANGTGTSGKATFSAVGSTLYISNRIGATLNLRLYATPTI